MMRRFLGLFKANYKAAELWFPTPDGPAHYIYVGHCHQRNCKVNVYRHDEETPTSDQIGRQLGVLVTAPIPSGMTVWYCLAHAPKSVG